MLSLLTAVDNTQAVTSTVDGFVQEVQNEVAGLDFFEAAKVLIMKFGPPLLWAICILVGGLIAIRIAMRVLDRALKKSKIDPAAHSILRSLIKVGLYLILATSVCSALNIDLTMFVAVVSVLGLAISLAVKDSLANFASGILLVFSHPFTIGNFIATDSVSGTVEEIGLIYTRLNTVDNKHIYIPNGQLSSAKITNFSAEKQRQVELIFSIGYDNDAELAKSLIYKMVENHPMAIMEPKPLIRVKEYGASSVNIICRVWVESANYWDLYYDLVEGVRKVFDENNINIPYDQVDVHVVSNPQK